MTTTTVPHEDEIVESVMVHGTPLRDLFRVKDIRTIVRLQVRMFYFARVHQNALFYTELDNMNVFYAQCQDDDERNMITDVRTKITMATRQEYEQRDAEGVSGTFG